MVELSSLQRDGYVVLRNALSAEACDSVAALLSRFPFKERKRLGVRFAKNCLAHCPDVGRHLAVSGQPGGVRPEDALYDEFVEYFDFAGSYPWHQDAAHFPEAVVSVSLALSPIREGQGGFTVLPGSHAAGVVQHGDTKMGLAAANVSENSALPLELERGDIVLNHPHLVHRMNTNRSKSPTRLYTVVLGSAGGAQQGEAE